MLLALLPGLALQDILQVDGAVTIAKADLWVTVRKALVVEGVWRGDASPIEAVQLHTWWRHGLNQPFCVLPHQPAIFKSDVLEELAIVTECVVTCGCVHKYLFM